MSFLSIQAIVECIKFSDEVMFPFFSIFCSSSFTLFYDSDFHIRQGVPWCVEVMTSGFISHMLGDITTVFCNSRLQHSFCLSYVHFLTFIFLAENCINTIISFAIKWFVYFPVCSIYSKFVSFFYVGT